MTYKYFRIRDVISRISLDENLDPNYCETYNSRIKEFVRNNSILEDLFNHSDSVEITEQEFDERLKVKKTSDNEKIGKLLNKHKETISKLADR